MAELLSNLGERKRVLFHFGTHRSTYIQERSTKPNDPQQPDPCSLIVAILGCNRSFTIHRDLGRPSVTSNRPLH